MEKKSLKTQAEEIMVAVDRDLEEVEATPSTIQEEVNARASAIMRRIFGVISEVDIEAATTHVAELRQKYPDAGPAELSQILIREKSRRTGMVGAVTSGAGLIPGVGTAAAMTLGVAADIGATFKLQAELVLEIAAAYGYPLTEEEKQRIVLLITGISAGTTALTRKAGQTIALVAGEKVAEKAVQKTFLKALPVVGVIASAGTNVLSTYIIGQRADAYFRLGPDAVGSWGENLRAISGIDEREIGAWLAENGKAAGAAVATGAGKVADTVGPALASGAQKAGETAQAGARAYLRWTVVFWTAVFRGVAKLVRSLWVVISFIPRKIVGLLGQTRKPKAGDDH